MPRPPLADEAGGLYHALNRGNLRATIFHKDADYEAFERILYEALQIHQIELYSFQLMPNHYHLVLRPLVDGEMSRFMGWVGGTHTMRYHAHYHTSGMGHVYQQRYKSFPIQADDHFFVACRSRRAKCPAGGTGRSSRRLAVEFVVALASQARAPAAAAVSSAARAASGLRRACQHAVVRGRTGSGASFRPAWQTPG